MRFAVNREDKTILFDDEYNDFKPEEIEKIMSIFTDFKLIR